MITNLLLAILIGFKIMEYISVRIDKERGMILSKKDKQITQKDNGDNYREKLTKLHSLYKKQLKDIKDDLDAHKVFTTKSFSELTNTPAVPSDKKKNKTYQKLVKSIRKPKGLKFTNFQLDKEIFRHLQKRDLLKVLNIKYIKDIKSQCGEEYANEKQKAYQRLWARQNYQLKRKANE